MIIAETALDPSFWQALGKALGWDDFRAEVPLVWRSSAHRFYDLILTNGDAERIWKEVLGE